MQGIAVMADWSQQNWKELVDCKCKLTRSSSGRGRRIYIERETPTYIHIYIKYLTNSQPILPVTHPPLPTCIPTYLPTYLATFPSTSHPSPRPCTGPCSACHTIYPFLACLLRAAQRQCLHSDYSSYFRSSLRTFHDFDLWR